MVVLVVPDKEQQRANFTNHPGIYTEEAGEEESPTVHQDSAVLLEMAEADAETVLMGTLLLEQRILVVVAVAVNRVAQKLVVPASS